MSSARLSSEPVTVVTKWIENWSTNMEASRRGSEESRKF